MRSIERQTWVDILDPLIDKGLYLKGDLNLGVANIELIHIGVQVVVHSISRLEKTTGQRIGTFSQPNIDHELKNLERQLECISLQVQSLMESETPPQAENGLAKLVISLITLISGLMEREAERRVEAGYLSQAEIQRLGLTLEVIRAKLEELRLYFGLSEEDMNLNLGSTPIQ